MSEKLTIVVTCTARKLGVATPDLHMRNLPEVSLPERADIWTARVRDAVDKRPLETLYKGEQWTTSKKMASAAAARGFEVSLLVVSAGLGLKRAADVAPAYGATFARGHEDSVARTASESRLWWSEMTLREEPGSPSLARSDKVLLVLSELYADALDADLRSLAARGVDALVVGGARDIDGLPRLRPRLELRRALGGTAISLNTRMAARWLELMDPGQPLAAPQTRDSFNDWAGQVAVVEKHERAPLSDDDVRHHVRLLRDRDPSISATRALRDLRGSGRACEQKRFHRLFGQEHAS